MQLFAVLCLAAVALARPQTYGDSGAVTTVTERTFTVRGDADKYYGTSGSSAGAGFSAGFSSGLSSGASSFAAAPAQASYSFEAAQPAVQQYFQQAAAPAQQYYQQAAPVAQYYQQAAPAQQYYSQFQQYQAAPAVSYQAAAPVAFQAVTAAPALAYTAAPSVAYTAAPAVAYQAAAPAVSYQAAAPAVSYQAAAPSVGIRSESSFENNYESNLQQSQVADTKVYKHVYAFAAPEEPATRARINVQAPVSKSKHYKLVFIKAPSQQTIVDSDITLPAQEEEKTLIYVLSKNQKQIQPEIRIKQAAAAKHAKPEVFFLKYKNEAEAQSIASGAISGQNADVPADGEIISDGSVSILGQSGASASSGSFGSFGSSFDNSFRAAASPSNIQYRSGLSSGNAGFSALSAGTSGIVAAAPVAAAAAAPAAAPAASFSSGFGSGSSSFGSGFGSGSSSFGSGFGSGSSFGAGLSSGFSSFGANQDSASVAVKTASDASESLDATTAGSLSL